MKKLLKLIMPCLLAINGQSQSIPKAITASISVANYQISGRLDKINDFKIELVKKDATRLSPESMDILDSYDGWCGDKYLLHDSIAKINVLISGKPIFFPSDSVLGLPYPDKLKIWKDGKQVNLQLSLGDGGYAYVLTLKLTPSKRKQGLYTVSERVLMNGEFPSEVWQKTQYHNDRWDSDL